jgi:hypothetical protein
MNIPEGLVGLLPTPLSLGPERLGWQKIGNALGRVFSALLSIPLTLIPLVRKIALLASERISHLSPQHKKDPISSEVSNNHVSPDLGDLFHDTLDVDQKLKNSPDPLKAPQMEEDEEISPDSEIDESPQSPVKEHVGSQQIGKKVADAEINFDEEIEEIEEFEEEPIKESPVQDSPIKENPEAKKQQSSEASPIAPAQEKAKVVVKPTVIDVPDNGNCLFYALAVGLRKKYMNNTAIQEKLNWSAKPDQLTGNLKTAVDLLDPPGKKLREQAAAYLKEHLVDEEIMLALMEGVGSHIEVAQRKINEEEDALPFAREEVENLEKELRSLPNQSSSYAGTLKQRIKENKDLIEKKEQSIQFLRDNLPNEDDLPGYIDITEKDKVYAGIAQALALSKEYNVPVQVLNFYGTPHEYPQLFEQADKQSQPPIITIAHVNGNHFQFVDD